MIPITINDQHFEVSKDLSVLEAAREQGIHIPTLCYHEALESVGACRLCVVEVTMNGRSRTAASCVTPVTEGMVVQTNTEKIRKIRRVLMELLLARCPDLKILHELAKEAGLKEIRLVGKRKIAFCAVYAYEPVERLLV
jgi:bidirectional [NiFe] hydrogenase diaphorase subunit